MALDPAKREALMQRVDAIEDCYEFLLSYAAQGRVADGSSGPGSQIRGYLEAAEEALGDIAKVMRDCFIAGDAKAEEGYGPFVALIEDDAKKSRATIKLVLAQKGISSQLADNFNNTIHVRALLTDVFLIDEALKTAARLEAGT